MSGLAEWLIFLGLAAIAVVTAAGMLVTMSMYRAGLALMSSFVALAGLFILLDADLLAAIQVMMNVGGMLVMILFMVMLMIDPGGEMMWDMKRKMRLPGPGALSMSMPRGAPPGAAPGPAPAAAPAGDWTCPMHPEVSAPGPGDCPICGMPLAPRADLAGDDAAGQARTYTCPMHPEIRQDHPGQCPICGMDLVPADEAAEPAPAAGAEAGAATTYTCPMHPEIRQDHPGQCPICGMDLVPTGETDAHAGHEPAAPAPAPPRPGAADHERADGHAGHAGMAGPTASGMSPLQHYQMMVDMAMSTAQLPWAFAIGAASAVLLVILVARTRWPLAGVAPTQDATAAVGELLLSRYMIGFEGAAFLILAGIVGAVIFARREATPVAPPAPAQAPAGAAIYTCPMHPEIRQDHPGQCPICSMDLVPADEAAEPAPAAGAEAGAATTYTCPMHPEIRQAGPGQCPICGMDLVPADEAAPAPAGRAADDHDHHGGHA